MDAKALEKLAEAERAYEAGLMSRREFNKLLTLLGLSAGLTLAQISPARAWMATRMRKSSVSPAGAYSLTGSCRFDASRSCYLTRTPGAAGNRKTWTLSLWLKRGALGSSRYLLSTANGGSSDTTFFRMGFDSGTEKLSLLGWGSTWRRTTQVFRDISGWQHLVVTWDTTQPLASERIRLYVNGVRITSFEASADPALNTDYAVNQAVAHRWGHDTLNSGTYWDGSMGEIHFIDGQALAPTAFGQIGTASGQWEPKSYTGSFGSNGYYLPFKSNSAVDGSGTASGSYPHVSGVSGMGADHSGNDNHWSGSGLATSDWTIDTALNNFCVINAHQMAGGTLPTTANAQLDFFSSATSGSANMTFGPFPSTGRWYCEFTALNVANNAVDAMEVGPSGCTYSCTGLRWNGSSYVSYGASYTTGDVIGLDFNSDTQTVTYYKNGVSQGAVGSVTPKFFYIYGSGAGYNWRVNFGQGGQSGLTYDSSSGGWFKHTPPSGCKTLSTAHLPTPAIAKPSDYFAALLYSGNGGVQRVGASVPSTQSYVVTRSLRFNDDDSPSLKRTGTGIASATGLGRVWTYSCWLKRGNLGTLQWIAGSQEAAGSGDQSALGFDTSNRLEFYTYATGSGYTSRKVSNAVFSNGSSWLHVLVSFDSTHGTAGQRVRIHVNGNEITSWSTSSDPASNHQSSFMVSSASTRGNRIGCRQWDADSGTEFFDGYLAEIHFVDGQALSPASFGQADATSGDWVPVQYSGGHGANGFHLNFSDNSNTTALTLGKDSSGNDNDWTPSGLSVSAGAGNDSLTDSPANSGSDSGGTGANASGNYCTLDPLRSGSVTLTNGRLTVTGSTGGIKGTVDVSIHDPTGYYFESLVESVTDALHFGVQDASAAVMTVYNYSIDSAMLARRGSGGGFRWNWYASQAGSSWPDNDTGVVGSNGDVLMCAVKQGKVWFGINGTWVNSGNPAAGTGAVISLAKDWTPMSVTYGQQSFNFGQRPFAYAPPAGFKCLSSRNRPSLSANVFSSTPDLVWLKSRSATAEHALFDSLRGAGADVASSSTAIEAISPTGLMEFTKTGFVTGPLAKVNTASASYVAWLWKKGATPGFDIVSYTGNGSTRTIAHSLGATPSVIFIKNRAVTNSWAVYHSWSHASPADYTLYLNSTSARVSAPNTWAGTAPTSSVFSVGTDNEVNTSSQAHVAYLWSQIDGFSRMASYTGNGAAEGPFVWCGFRPAFVIIKRADSSDHWKVYDSAREPWNDTSLAGLKVNATDDEANAGSRHIDFYANGFKIRNTDPDNNASGGVYIFMAFAEAPLKYAKAR